VVASLTGYIHSGHARRNVVKCSIVARLAISFALLLVISNISPSTRAWENSLPWCVVNDSGKVLQCFTMKEACIKEAEKQQKTCVLIPPKK